MRVGVLTGKELAQSFLIKFELFHSQSVSDSRSSGETEDKSGPQLKTLVCQRYVWDTTKFEEIFSFLIHNRHYYNHTTWMHVCVYFQFKCTRQDPMHIAMCVFQFKCTRQRC